MTARHTPSQPRHRATSHALLTTTVTLLLLTLHAHAQTTTPEQAAMDARVACDEGRAAGCYDLAVMTEHGVAVDADLPAAVSLLRQACRLDDQRACFALGEHFAAGAGVALDPGRARGLFEHACNGVEPRGCERLAMMLQAEPTPDAARINEVLTRACDASLATSCLMLADRLAQQVDSPVDPLQLDPLKLATLYERACVGGEHRACGLLAELAVTGQGEALQDAQVAGLHTLACEANYLPSCKALGRKAT